MRVKATIGASPMITLIDSSSTHNFISSLMATLLRLSVKATNSFPVRVTNSDKLHSHEHFDEVIVNIKVITFSLKLYSLRLKGLDLVLGIH